ncbi:hypothetical protein GCM10027284_47120 [Cyclobacterium sediminis]
MRLQIYHFNPNYDQPAQWIRKLIIDKKGKNLNNNPIKHLIINSLQQALKNYTEGEIAKTLSDSIEAHF